MQLKVVHGDNKPKPKPVNHGCVALLKEMLADAEKGDLEAVCIVGIHAGEPYIFWSDSDEDYDCQFLYGIEVLKYDLLSSDEE